jgi:hypothetical protein
MLKTLLLFLSVSDVGAKYIVEDKVDVIEINHFLNDQGQVQLDQIIFFDWSPTQSRYIVRAWRSYKDKSQLPMKLPDGGYVAIWRDNRDGVLRKVYAKSCRETWTNYDPETVNKEYMDRAKSKAQRKKISSFCFLKSKIGAIYERKN